MFRSCFSLLIFLCLYDCEGQIASCRSGWTSFRDSCYVIDGITTHWAEAESFCRAFHAKLAEIESPEENTFVKNLIVKKWPQGFHKNLAIWTGATDLETRDTWRWADTGSIMEFTDWGPGQPQQNDEHCMVYVVYIVGNAVIHVPSGLAPDGLTYVSNSISNIYMYLSEPQNTAYQDHSGGTNYSWHDYPCDFQNYFICEQELVVTNPDIIG